MVSNYELKNIDSEDIDDLLIKIEQSFNVRFEGTELLNIVTFGELCDHISNKIQLENSEDCTSQQAFYKLRDVICNVLELDKRTVNTDSDLLGLLPRQKRRLLVKKIENHLGFKLNILRPPHWVSNTLSIIFLLALVTIFFKWEIGVLGIAFSLIGLWFANKVSNELDLKTVGQVVEKITRENYLKSRRNSKTFNKREIEKVLIDLFSNDLDLDRSKLTREAKFI